MSEFEVEVRTLDELGNDDWEAPLKDGRAERFDSIPDAAMAGIRYGNHLRRTYGVSVLDIRVLTYPSEDA